MKYLKLFEDFKSLPKDVQKNALNAEDITAYIPGEVGGCLTKWILPNFDLKRILDDEKYSKYKGSDKGDYIRYYVIGFVGKSNIYKAIDDIKHRANVEGLKFFIIDTNQRDLRCDIVFFAKEDWGKLNLKEVEKSIRKTNTIGGDVTKGWDILFEDDLLIDKSEFDVLYDDEKIMAIKPKSYKAAIKYSADMPWKMALKKNLSWIEKYMTKGSYYGGYNWYKSKKTTGEVKNWWQKLFNLPGKQKEIQTKEFIQDFPRYLMYIVIFKKLPPKDKCSRLYLLYDISRDEYGEMPRGSSDYGMFGGHWGDKLDSSHNQLKISSSSGNMITLKEIWHEHQSLFNRAFREIESDMESIKDSMYDLLGFWANKGGEYTKDALVFVRNQKDRLGITKPSLMKTDDKGNITFDVLGYYDDPEFDWWELDKEKPKEKMAPNNGYKDYFKSMVDDVEKLKSSLDKSYGALGGTDFKIKT